MLTLLISLAYAEPGFECEVVWAGPVAGCPIDGAISTRASRKNVDAAEKAARRQLARLLELTSEDLVSRSSTRSEAEYVLCEDIVNEELAVECTEDATTLDGDFCFVTFDDPECWNGDVLTIDRGGWRAVVDGRRMMCEAVDEMLILQNYTGLEERRRECGDRCAIETRVSCPSEE